MDLPRLRKTDKGFTNVTEIPGVADKLLAQIRRQPIFVTPPPTQFPKMPNRQERMKTVWQQLIRASRPSLPKRKHYRHVARWDRTTLRSLTSTDLSHLFAIFRQRSWRRFSEGRKGLSDRYKRVTSAIWSEIERRNKLKAVKEASAS